MTPKPRQARRRHSRREDTNETKPSVIMETQLAELRNDLFEQIKKSHNDLREQMKKSHKQIMRKLCEIQPEEEWINLD